VPPGNRRGSDLRRTCSVRRKIRDSRTPGRTARSAVAAGGSCIMRAKGDRLGSRSSETGALRSAHHDFSSAGRLRQGSESPQAETANNSHYHPLIVLLTYLESHFFRFGGRPSRGRQHRHLGVDEHQRHSPDLSPLPGHRNVVKLFFERKRRIFGHRLRTNWSIAFIALSLMPTVILFRPRHPVYIYEYGVLVTTSR